MLKLRDAIHQDVASNILSAQARQKKNYENRRLPKPNFKSGEKVLLCNLRRSDRKGGKFSYSWFGPYSIGEVFDNRTVTLINVDGVAMKTKANIVNLKHYTAKDNMHVEIPQQSHSDMDVTTSDDHDCTLTAVDMRILNQSNDERLFQPINKDVAHSISTQLGLQHKGTMSMKQCQKELGNPMKTQRVRGDGNCFFRAVSVYLTGSEENHAVLRDLVVKHMCEDPLKGILDGYLNKDVLSYINDSKIEGDGTWATDAEIYATAHLIKMDIEVFCKYSMEYPKLGCAITPPALQQDLKRSLLCT